MKAPAYVVAHILFVAMSGLLATGAEFKSIEFAHPGEVRLTFDAHIPEGQGPFPAAILVHGGGWVAGDKQQYITYIFQPLTDAGFAWFSINYRLAPQFKFPSDADDVESAIRFVKANAAKYKVDPKRMVLIGAGGHLVSYVGARNRTDANVAAVVSMYGIHDFVAAAVEWKPLPHELLDLDVSIIYIARQRVPARERVTNRCRCVRLARELRRGYTHWRFFLPSRTALGNGEDGNVFAAFDQTTLIRPLAMSWK